MCGPKNQIGFRAFITECRRFAFRVYLALVNDGGLTEEQALSRVFVVSFIELLGVVLTMLLVGFAPYLFSLGGVANWQIDCFIISCVLFLTGLSVLATFALTWKLRWRPCVPEGIILFTFVVNIIAFTLAMARTGGPSHSFFGQLVPMQLSGILILEEQKTIMTSKEPATRRRGWVYAVFSIVVWLTVMAFPSQLQWLFRWKEMTIKLSLDPSEQSEANLRCYQDFVATFLFILGVFVTALAYRATPQLAAWFERPEGKQNVPLDVASGTN